MTRAKKHHIVQVEEGEYIFQGRVELVDFNEVMGSQLPTEETETWVGLSTSRWGACRKR